MPMTIDKAIEILNDPDHYLKLVLEHDQLDAIKLGIEALRRINLGRSGVQRFAHTLLPGETVGGNNDH